MSTDSLSNIFFTFDHKRVLAIETHANPKGFAALSGRKGTRFPSFFFSFFCFFFRNSMLSVRVRVSRLRLSSTSHYVRAKKISREFHISPSSRVFLHHRLSFPPLFSEIASTLRSLSALNRQERSMANRVANGSYANLKLL